MRRHEPLSFRPRPVDTSKVTLLADPAAAPGATAPRASRARAAWRGPVWAHLVALAVVLLCLLAVVGTSSSFSADEGAAIAQARSLSEGRGWMVPHPAPELDPGGVNYPLEFSERGPGGWAPYAKHPLYPLLLAGAHRLGGVTAMVLLSLAGTVAAAGLAGALARRLDAALVRPAIWVTGLASPLLFDGYLLIAHTLGAALAGAAVLAAVVAIERRSALLALTVMPAVAAGVMLRSEALFIAGALAVLGGIVALRRREVRVPATVVALGSLSAGGGSRVLDALWTAHIVGSAGPTAATAPAAGDSSGLIAGRVQGLLVTWLTPGYGGQTVTGLALLVMLAAIAVGAFTVRRSPGNGGRIVSCAAVAAAAAISAVFAGPGTVVPGLLLAFPLAGAGLLLVSRRTLQSTTAQITSGVCALFALAVLATQYAKGGGGEWGGRYFALAIPIGVPILLLALWDQRAKMTPSVTRRAAAGLVVCSLALTTMGVSALRASHRANARLVAAVERAGRTVGPDRPLMVTTEGAMPRFAWPTSARQRWLLATPDGLDHLLGRLRQAGVTRVGFVSRNLPRDRVVLDRAGVRIVSVDGSESSRRWQVLVLEVDPE